MASADELANTPVMTEDNDQTPIQRPTFGKWAVIVCGSLNFGLSISLPVSLSVMFLDWQDSFQVSRAHTAAVHSTCVGILFAGGIVAGYVIDRFGPRVAQLSGTFLASFGLFLSSFATSIDYLIVTTGVIAGFGFCLLQLPCIPCVSLAVTKYKSLAISLCSFGCSVFNMCLPYLYTVLVHHFSWRGAFIIISGLTLNTAVLGLIMTSSVSSPHTVVNLSSSKSDKGNSSLLNNTEADISQDVSGEEAHTCIDADKLDEKLEAPLEPLNGQDREGKLDNDHEQSSVPLLNNGKTYLQNHEGDEIMYQKDFHEMLTEENGFPCSDKKAKSSRMEQLYQNLKGSKWKFMIDPLFLCVLLFISLTLGILFSFSLMMMDFARTKGFGNESTGVLFIQVMAVSGISGRFGSGLLNLIPNFHSIYVMCIFGGLGSVAMAILGVLTHFTETVCVLVAVACGMGGVLGIYPKCILDIEAVGPELFPLALGIACTTEGVFDTLIPVLIGHMVDVTNSYFIPLLSLGITAFCVSTCLALQFCLTHRYTQRNKLKNTVKTVREC